MALSPDPGAEVLADAMLAPDFVALGARMTALRRIRFPSWRALMAEQERLLATARLDSGPDLDVGTRRREWRWISEQALRRFERHEGRPPRPSEGEFLDRLYGGQGWITLSVNRLHDADWDPWSQHWPATTHLHRWPPRLTAQVWVRVFPRREHADLDHSFVFEWPDRSRRLTAALPQQGVRILLSTVATTATGASVLRVTCVDRQFYALFGADEVRAQVPVIDIQEGWQRW